MPGGPFPDGAASLTLDHRSRIPVAVAAGFTVSDAVVPQFSRTRVIDGLPLANLSYYLLYFLFN